MEPTTNTNKTKMMIILVVVIIIVVGVIFILKSKKDVAVTPENQQQNTNITPSLNTGITKEETNEITKYIDSATTFDNEAQIKEIEKEF